MSTLTASTESQQIYAGVVAFQPLTGKTLYAQAQMDFFEKNLSLDFQTATQPFSEMKRCFEQEGKPPLEIDDQASPSFVQSSLYSYYSKPPSQDQRSSLDQRVQKVQNVLINLDLPPAELYPTLPVTYVSLINQIGKVSRKIFPNFRADKSAYNVRIGFSSYRADYYLLSEQTEDGPVILLSK